MNKVLAELNDKFNVDSARKEALREKFKS